MKCKELKLENGLLTKHNLTVNSTIYFACKKGYERKGIRLRICVSTSTTAFWDPPEETNSVSFQGSLEIDQLYSFTLYILFFCNLVEGIPLSVIYLAVCLCVCVCLYVYFSYL